MKFKINNVLGGLSIYVSEAELKYNSLEIFDEIQKQHPTDLFLYMNGSEIAYKLDFSKNLFINENYKRFAKDISLLLVGHYLPDEMILMYTR